MREELTSLETLVWIVLMVLTTLSWVLGANHGLIAQDASWEMAVLVIVAFFKIRLIMLYFMEVRHGPMLLRLSTEVWILSSCVGVIFFVGDFT